MLLIDAMIVIIVAFLGNELRLIIDEQHDDRAEETGRHNAATVRGLVSSVRLVRQHQQIAETAALFERVAYDFESAAMSWPTSRFVAVEGE